MHYLHILTNDNNLHYKLKSTIIKNNYIKYTLNTHKK